MSSNPRKFKINILLSIKSEILKEALKYKTRSHFQKGSRQAYSVAAGNGWLEECYKHMPRAPMPAYRWTREKCLNEALKFNSRNEWAQGHKKSYQAAQSNPWFEECCAHMRPKYSQRLDQAG